MDPKNNPHARAAWDAYRQAVGGYSFKGERLPDWETLCADPEKQSIVQGWIAAADASIKNFLEEAKKKCELAWSRE